MPADRAAQARNGVETEYDYNTLNQLTHEVTDGAHTYYTYDADGQLASRQDGGGTTDFAWDFESRMREAGLADETTWEYRYILGSQRWRKWKVDANERTDFVYDGEKVAEEHDYSGANQATYTHAGSSIYSPLLAQRTDNTSAWFLQDALGSTMALIDSDEALLLQVLYDAWGNELLSNGNGQTPYRYVGAYGYYRDVETGLMCASMRYYSGTRGRWLRRDPMLRSLNRYSYVLNSPALYVDPSGLLRWAWIKWDCAVLNDLLNGARAWVHRWCGEDPRTTSQTCTDACESLNDLLYQYLVQCAGSDIPHGQPGRKYRRDTPCPRWNPCYYRAHPAYGTWSSKCHGAPPGAGGGGGTGGGERRRYRRRRWPPSTSGGGGHDEQGPVSGGEPIDLSKDPGLDPTWVVPGLPDPDLAKLACDLVEED